MITNEVNKKNLIEELTRTTYVRLLPSPLHGIGVFAIQSIPKGCRSMFADEEGEWELLTFEEVESLPRSSRELVENFCLYDEQHYFIPSKGFKNVDLSLFLNHSDSPNVASIDEGRYFEALCDILPGEELLVDYGTLVE
ncbi:MAG: SET domain-containing protein [Saprospiraceae bacterium]|nr:SET domain-containing protein [Saprospiraceae bacterium]